jgi:hypothetical protein
MQLTWYICYTVGYVLPECCCACLALALALLAGSDWAALTHQLAHVTAASYQNTGMSSTLRKIFRKFVEGEKYFEFLLTNRHNQIRRLF